jgi:tripartite-type tricarboxylate transporter receptor subunit TctC
VNRTLGLSDVKERFAQQGALPAPLAPERFQEFLKDDVAKWAKVVKASGAKVE